MQTDNVTHSRKWSFAAKERNRRRRAARRIFRKFPLLAVSFMRDLEFGGNGEFRYPDYTYSQLDQDLKRKTPEKKKEGKRTKPETFKQVLLKKWRAEIALQISQDKEADPKLVRKYYMLLNNSSTHVQIEIKFQKSTCYHAVPHSATETTAKKLIAFINEAVKVCESKEQLEQEVRNYEEINFFRCGK